MPFLVHSDAPATRDLLDFDRYLDPLLDILKAETLETPVTIGVFGTWGSGKSTLLGLLKNGLPESFVCVEFNPWIFHKEPNLLIPLLQQMHETLTRSTARKIKASAAKIAEVLLRLGADLLLKHVTFEKVGVEKLEKLEKEYLTRKGLIECPLASVRKSLREMASALGETKIILLIDDLDRCEPADIIDLLESLKLFLDVKNIVTVLAVDKEVIDRGVEVKYQKFSFAADRFAGLGAEYLEKMVQIPVYLYPLHPDQVRGYINKHDFSAEIQAQVELLVDALRPNPRKIKRVLNAIGLTEGALRKSTLDRRLTTGLVVLRVEEPELFADVARLPKLLVGLQRVFAKVWNTNDVTVFHKDFQDRKEFVRERCARYYRETGPVAAVFRHCDFAAAKEPLADYVSVVGGR